MANGYAFPIFATAGLTYFNDWYSNGDWEDVKPLVAGGVAYLLAAGISQIPGAEPIVTGIAWIALAAAIVVPASSGGKTILDPLFSLANG